MHPGSRNVGCSSATVLDIIINAKVVQLNSVMPVSKTCRGLGHSLITKVSSHSGAHAADADDRTLDAHGLAALERILAYSSPRLHTLALRSCGLPSMDFMRGAGGARSLTHLDLSGNRRMSLDKHSATWLFLGMPALTHLDLSGCSSVDAQVVMDALHPGVDINLVHLDLNGVRARGPIRPALRRLTRLRHLGLAGTLVHDDKVLVELAHITDLEHLDISDNTMRDPDAGFTLPQALANMTALRHLSLRRVKFGYGQLSPILGTLTSLRHLDLGYHTRPDHIRPLMEALPALQGLTHLALANFTRGGGGDDVEDTLWDALFALPALETLGLAPGLVDWMWSVPQLTSLRGTLRQLVIRGRDGWQGGWTWGEHLGIILGRLAPALRKLTISHTSAGPQALYALCPALAALTALEELDLSHNMMGWGEADDGYFSDAVDYNKPSRSALAGALEDMTSLTALDVACNCFTQAHEREILSRVQGRVSLVRPS